MMYQGFDPLIQDKSNFFVTVHYFHFSLISVSNIHTEPIIEDLKTNDFESFHDSKIVISVEKCRMLRIEKCLKQIRDG